MEKIQTLLISYLLQPLANVMNKIPQRARIIIFYLCGEAYFVLTFLNGSGRLNVRYFYIYAICCFLFGCMLLCTMPKEIRPIKFRKSITICWFLLALLMLQSGLRNNIDFLPDTMLVLIAFPVFYIVWNNADWQQIMKKLCLVCAGSAVIYILVTMFFFPMKASQYNGLYTNVNGLGQYVSLVLPCLMMLVLAEKRWILTAVYSIIFGVMAALLFYSGSRAGELSAICSAVFVCGMLFLGGSWRQRGVIAAKVTVLCCMSLLLINTTVFIYQDGYQFKTAVAEHLFSADAPPVNTPPVDTPPVDTPPVDTPPVDTPPVDTPPVDTPPVDTPPVDTPPVDTPPVETPPVDTPPVDTPPVDTPPVGGQESNPPKETPPVVDGIDGFIEVAENKGSFEGRDLTSITSGRTLIWSGFLKEVNLFGHGERITVPFTYGRETTNPHNTIVAMIYDYGIIAGLFYFAVNLLSGFLAILFAWKNRRENWALFPLAVIVAFGIESMLETLTGIYYPPAMYYFMVLFPLFVATWQPPEEGKTKVSVSEYKNLGEIN